MNNLNIVGLVLARGGSKRIPNKNIKDLNGRPLIGYVLDEMVESDLWGIYVSTDSEEIAKVAKEENGLVYMRPPELATDNSKSIDAVKHFIKYYRFESRVRRPIDAICLVNACTPFVTKEDINECLKLLEDADSVVSLVESPESHPSKTCYIDKKTSDIVIDASFEPRGYKTLPKIYRRNTAIYVARKSVIMSGTFFGEKTKGYVMSQEHSLDINTEFDFLQAELLMSYEQGRESNL